MEGTLGGSQQCYMRVKLEGQLGGSPIVKTKIVTEDNRW
jgi:hypothetical protein